MKVLLRFCPRCDGSHEEGGELVKNSQSLTSAEYEVLVPYTCRCDAKATVYLITVPI